MNNDKSDIFGEQIETIDGIIAYPDKDGYVYLSLRQ